MPPLPEACGSLRRWLLAKTAVHCKLQHQTEPYSWRVAARLCGVLLPVVWVKRGCPSAARPYHWTAGCCLRGASCWDGLKAIAAVIHIFIVCSYSVTQLTRQCPLAIAACTLSAATDTQELRTSAAHVYMHVVVVESFQFCTCAGVKTKATWYLLQAPQSLAGITAMLHMHTFRCKLPTCPAASNH